MVAGRGFAQAQTVSDTIPLGGNAWSGSDAGVSGQGTIPDLILQADELVRLRAELESVLSEHTGQSVETLRTDTDRDRIFTAKAALDYGLVDQILMGR